MRKVIPIGKAPACSFEQRIRAGREQRNRVSRKQLGQVHSHNRSFQPIDVLLQCQAGRSSKLLPLKYSRMAVSPFAFFRGSVGIMAADLASEPHTGLTVQLCGDAHLQNLGSFEGPDGRLVFDINDFDETIPGPWEWDVKRMATSIVLAGYESNHGRTTCARAVEEFAGSYCRLLGDLAKEPILTAARHQIGSLRKVHVVSAALDQAARATPCDLLAKYTVHQSHGGYQFKSVPHLLWRVAGQTRKDVLASLPVYRAALTPERMHWLDFFQLSDVGFKISGTGSVGLCNYVALLFGNGESDPLFLQIKQQTQSAYAPYLNLSFSHEGQRVAEGQRRIQPLSDLLLGWTRIGSSDYLVRQLNDHKGKVDLTTLREEGLGALSKVAGELYRRRGEGRLRNRRICAGIRRTGAGRLREVSESNCGRSDSDLRGNKKAEPTRSFRANRSGVGRSRLTYYVRAFTAW